MPINDGDWMKYKTQRVADPAPPVRTGAGGGHRGPWIKPSSESAPPANIIRSAHPLRPMAKRRRK